MPRNDKTFLRLHTYLLKKDYKNEWTELPNNKYALQLLAHASKKNSGEGGLPDFSYINTEEKILILGELKQTTAQRNDAIRDIKHYLKFFDKTLYPQDNIFKPHEKETELALSYFENFNIIGVSVAGDISIENGHIVDTFIINKVNPLDTSIKDLQINEIKDESEYINLLKNEDKEVLIENISNSSALINNLLYDVKEDKRPTL